MKKNEVKINAYYTAKVTDKLTVIRIIDENPHGGWDAVNTRTGKKIRIKAATRLREEVNPDGTPIKPKAKKKEAKPQEPTAQTVGDETAEPGDDTTPPEQSPTDQPGATGGDGGGLVLGEVTGAPEGNKMSLMDAAVAMMQETGEAMNTKRMVELVTQRGLWQPSRGGKTPENTLYSSILREIKDKGDDSRFEKVGRGQFALKK